MSAAAAHAEQPPAPAARRSYAVAVPGSGAALAVALSFTVASGLLTSMQVDAYYRTHVPHFDSIGSYTIAFRIMNATRDEGLLGGIAAASAISLSWLQPFFALLVSGLPSRSPAWLVSLNFIVMATVQLAIAVWCRERRYSWQRTAVFMLLPYVPGAFYAWDGGLQDWRRDIQLNLLLIGVLFISLAHIFRPTWAKGLAFGVLMGLAQWSRDNALAMIVVVVAPSAIIALGQSLRSRQWGGLLTFGVVPSLAYLAMAVPYYALTIQTTIARYLYSVWGPGEDRWASLARFWTAPADVLLGGASAYNGMPATGQATAIGLLVAGVLLAAGLGTGLLRPTPTRLLGRDSQALIWSGAFVVVAVIVYNTLGLGYGAQYHGMPFVPVSAGIVALVAGLANGVAGGSQRGRLVRTAALLVVVVGLLGLNAYRIKANEFAPVGAETVAAVQDAAVRIADLAQGRPVAVLWLSGFSRYHIAYFQAQSGRSAPSVTATEFEGPLRQGQRAEEVLAPLEEQARARAAVIVVCEDTSRYADPKAVSVLFRDGRPMIERILADPAFEIAHRFRVEPFPIVVLQRRATADAGEAGR